jgi:hypothetical protein
LAELPARGAEIKAGAASSVAAAGPVTGWRHSTRLPRDHYLRLDGNDYSVHPAAIGRRVELHASLHRVQVFS